MNLITFEALNLGTVNSKVTLHDFLCSNLLSSKASLVGIVLCVFLLVGNYTGAQAGGEATKFACFGDTQTQNGAR